MGLHAHLGLGLGGFGRQRRFGNHDAQGLLCPHRTVVLAQQVRSEVHHTGSTCAGKAFSVYQVQGVGAGGNVRVAALKLGHMKPAHAGAVALQQTELRQHKAAGAHAHQRHAKGVAVRQVVLQFGGQVQGIEQAAHHHQIVQC